MKKKKLTLFNVLFFGLLLAAPQLVHSQMVIGQYEDEAPLQSWNTYGLLTAASLGRGGAGFTLGDDSSSALLNPALLTRLPKLSIAVSGAYNTASMYRYSIINTGILRSSQNQSLGVFSGDYIGISGSLGGWALAISVSSHENYSRPSAIWNYTQGGQTYYTLDFEQDGILVNTNLSLARKINDRLSIGIGLNMVQGKFEKTIEERWTVSDRTITDRKKMQLSGFYLNGGAVWNPSEKMSLAVVFRTPYKRKADSESLYRFLAPNTYTDIQIEGSGESTFLQPLVLGLGVNFDVFKDLAFTADASFFNWAQYEVEFFGETLQRDFKDVVRLNAGFELNSEYTFFNMDSVSPFRFGFIYDPQPMRNPGSHYIGFTLGTGLHVNRVKADLAYFNGKETGSDNHLTVTKILFTISFQIGETR